MGIGENMTYAIEHELTFEQICDLMAQWNENAKKNGTMESASVTLYIDLDQHDLIPKDEAHEYCNDGRE